MKQSIGANIKALRRALGINQEDLARKLNLTQANISRIEANAKGPSAETLVAIAEALGCDVRELMGVDGETQPVQLLLDEDAKTFSLNILRADPLLGIYLRSFVKKFSNLTDEDWRFLAENMKLVLGYAGDAIEAKRMKAKL